jgi:hypothetical protein
MNSGPHRKNGIFSAYLFLVLKSRNILISGGGRFE